MMTISTLNLIANVLSFIFRLTDIYSWILVAYALMSWIPQLQSSIVGRWIIKLVRPYLNLFDRLPLQFAGLDFTVLVALISIQVIEKFIVIVFNALV